MMPERDLEKLLRGYTAGKLTEEERRALFEAALHDPRLFAALAREQAMKNRPDDPRRRRRILEWLRRSSSWAAQPWLERTPDWLRRPANWALSGSLASALVAVIALGHLLLQAGPKTTEPMLSADAGRSGSHAESRPSAPVKQASPKAKIPSAQSAGGIQAEKKDGSRSQPAAKTTQEIASKDRLTNISQDKAPVSPLPSREPAPEIDLKSSTLKPAAQPPAATVPPPPKEAQQDLATTPQPASPEATPADPEEEAVVLIPPELLPPLGKQKSAIRPGREQRRARSLFYAQAQLARTDPGKTAEEQLERPLIAQAPKAETEDTAQGLGLPGQVEVPTPVRNQPIGLRYSILKQGKEGVETEADPAERFEASATLKLTVEVNAPGFLYVLKRDSARIWTVLHPTTEQKEGTAAPNPRVETRTRLEFPLAGAMTANDQPVRTDAFILYSRQAQPDLNSIIALITGDPSQGGSRAALVDAFIQRARRNAELQHFLIQKMDSPKKGASKERAVYVVDLAPDPSSPVFVEIAVSQQ
jgi:hypothetical protein